MEINCNCRDTALFKRWGQPGHVSNKDWPCRIVRAGLPAGEPNPEGTGSVCRARHGFPATRSVGVRRGLRLSWLGDARLALGGRLRLRGALADARMAAGYRSSSGHRIRVSICLVAPPAVSRLHIDVPDFPERLTVHPVPIAVHGDSVLVNLKIVQDGTVDAVVYSAGALPSLSLLPSCHFTLKGEDEEMRRMVYPLGRVLEKGSTGLLRCGGGGEFVVAYLKLTVDDVEEAELCVFRRPGWELKRLPVRHGMVKRDDMWGWQPDAAVAVGGRYLCLGDLSRGIIFWDALADGPELRYVSLPLAEPLRRCRGRGEYALYRRSRSLCVAGEALKIVDVAPRCCCGGLAATRCPRSKYAFRITTWTLRTEDMTWWQDGEMDAAELWALPAYGRLPRLPVEYTPS